MKQAIIIRSDLKMGKGKAAAQVAHASLDAYKNSPFISKKQWELTGQKKVVLKTEDLKSLTELFMHAKREKIPLSLIKDAGRTQVPAGTITCLALGPAEDQKIDRITKDLKLY
ncbi:MAG: peptidyl-tRNA hydrolase Pth2 [archaeon]